MDEAIVKKKSGISVIWILPIIALLVGGYIAYKSYQDKGVMIRITFNEINGVTAGKTQVMHRGLPLGIVKSYTIDYKKNKIYLDIEMVKEVEPYLFDDLQFWIVRPEISTTRITGLDTLLAGSYIAIKPGHKSKTLTREFEGLSEPPPIPAQSIAHRLTFTTSSKDSLSVGAPLLFKKMPVGEIVSIKFKKDSTDLDVGAVIYKKYADLVAKDSYFWNASGLRVTASFDKGLEMQLGSMQTLIEGGICFATPPNATPLQQDTAEFKLYENQDDAEGSVLTRVYFSFVDPAGIKVGTAIKFKGVEVGEITRLDMDETMDNVTAEATINKKAKKLFSKDSHFWVENRSLRLNNLGSVQQMMAGAYIAMSSGKGDFADHFVVNQSAPKLHKADDEVIVILQTPRLGSLSVGSPVLYRQIVVGEVSSFNLSESKQYVEVYVKILAPYTSLISRDSYFWNASGLRVTASFDEGVEMELASMQSLVVGGICFATPANAPPLRQENARFRLFENEDDAADSVQSKVYFSLVDPAGIKVGTLIKFNGVEVGKITRLDMDETMDNVTAEAIINKKAQKLFTKESRFWVENKSLSLNNLGSVQQIMAGAYIAMFSGDGEFADHFVVDQSAPKFLKADDELIIVLHTPRLGSLNVGSPLLYRQIVVGEVSSFNLSHTGQYVEVYVKIAAPYTPLVREESKFYLASGIRVEGGLMTTMKIATESLESLVTGGIAFVTPENSKMGKKVKTGHQFDLHEDIGEGWLRWSPEFSLKQALNTPHIQPTPTTVIPIENQ